MLPLSGPLSLKDIQTEFGGNISPIRLGDYYRGGLLLSSGVSSSIPTAGTIQIDDFYGTAKQIEPPMAVGEPLLGTFNSGARSTGTSSWATLWDSVSTPITSYLLTNLTIPSLWTEKNYTFDGTITAPFSYTNITWMTVIIKNGITVMTATSNLGNANYFNNTSGFGGTNPTTSIFSSCSVSGSNVVSLKGGDNIQILMYYGKRAVSGTASLTNVSVALKRTT